MAFQVPLTVSKALDRIHRHDYVIPAIQREFVWSQAQICNLFDSLLRKYPIGTFLFWQVPAADTKNYTFYDVMRDFHELKSRHSQKIPIPDKRDVTAILDGQQRLTSLNIGLHGSYAVKRPGARSLAFCWAMSAFSSPPAARMRPRRRLTRIVREWRIGKPSD